MADETVSQGSDASYEAQEARRLECIEHEHAALRLGEHDYSMRQALAHIVCAGRWVRQSEGGDMVAERALLRFAAATVKAVGIASVHIPGAEEGHHASFYDEDVSAALLGLSALLEAAPSLIDSFSTASLDLRSGGETCERGRATETGGDS